MKKFVLKLILFSGLILGSLVLLNFLYVRTEAYRTMNDMEKFYNVPDNLETQLMHFELTKRGRRKWIEESLAEELRANWMK